MSIKSVAGVYLKNGPEKLQNKFFRVYDVKLTFLPICRGQGGMRDVYKSSFVNNSQAKSSKSYFPLTRLRSASDRQNSAFTEHNPLSLRRLKIF